MRFKIDWASLIVRRKFTVFALFYFVFEGNFPSTSPQGAYIWRGDLMEGFLRYRVGGLYLEGLIHGVAYFRNFSVYNYNSSFICIVVDPPILNIITYILHTIFHTCPVVLTVVTGRIWITIRPSSKDNRELKQPRRRRWQKPHFKKSAFPLFQTSSLLFCFVKFIKCS